MNAVEAQAALRCFQLARDKVAQFITLISDLVQVLVSMLLEAVQETFFLKLVNALLEKLSWRLVPLLAKTKLPFDLRNQLCIV